MSLSREYGDTIERVKLHAEFGGRTQGGISPSSKTPNVFVFTDPVAGEQYGYIDEWREDGCFHYTGEGQRGDQQMKSGNRSILEHELAAGRYPNRTTKSEVDARAIRD